MVMDPHIWSARGRGTRGSEASLRTLSQSKVGRDEGSAVAGRSDGPQRLTSAAGVELARELGCNLVVLARECSLKEIDQIQAAQRGFETQTSLPLEVFVHADGRVTKSQAGGAAWWIAERSSA